MLKREENILRRVDRSSEANSSMDCVIDPTRQSHILQMNLDVDAV